MRSVKAASPSPVNKRSSPLVDLACFLITYQWVSREMAMQLFFYARGNDQHAKRLEAAVQEVVPKRRTETFTSLDDFRFSDLKAVLNKMYLNSRAGLSGGVTPPGEARFPRLIPAGGDSGWAGLFLEWSCRNDIDIKNQRYKEVS